MSDTPVMKSTRLSLLALMAAVAFAPIAASARDRQAEPKTKLHRCGEQTCLLVSGKRSDAAAPVLIEQHEVAVSGGKRWHVSLPLHTVRNWSAPAARAISVEIAGNAPRQMLAKLPIGVFGSTTKLAALSIKAP